MLKIWWIWKIEIWSEEVVDGYQTVPYEPGALFGGGLLSGSVSNSNLILTIPFQYYFKFHSFSCVPRLNRLDREEMKRWSHVSYKAFEILIF